MVEIARAETDADLEAVVVVRRETDPLARPTVDGLRHSLSTNPRLAYFVAREDGDVAGCGMCGGATSGYAFADARVLPALRGRGIGTSLLRAVSEHARGHGADGLTLETYEDDAATLGFLARRGYAEVERQKALALDLRGLEPPEVGPPEGIELVTRRDDLLRAMYEVALEADADIPGLDGEEPRTWEEWRAHEIDHPSRRVELTFVALAGEEVVAYGALQAYPPIAFHGLTGVKRAWRGRGVASAIKRAQIRAAVEAGFERLLTESEERNTPMRKLNEKMGYVPIPGTVVLRGPLLESAS